MIDAHSDLLADQAAWPKFTERQMVDLEEFYRADPRRSNGGHQEFGFDWKDPSVTQPNTVCEVRWYLETHEVAAVYSTYDPARLSELLGRGNAAMSVIRAGMINEGADAAALGRWLGDRDRAVTNTKVRLMGAVEHPLERYWVLRDAFFLETRPDGLLTLQRRIDACGQGERRRVAEDTWWRELSEWLGTSETPHTPH